MPVITIKSKAEFDAAVAKEQLSVIDAFAEWCGPCKMIAPTLKAMSDEEANANVQFLKFDVDECEDIAAALGIRAMPTFKFYKAGKQVDELVGANPAALKQKVEANRA